MDLQVHARLMHEHPEHTRGPADDEHDAEVQAGAQPGERRAVHIVRMAIPNDEKQLGKDCRKQHHGEYQVVFPPAREHVRWIERCGGAHEQRNA